MIWINGTGLTQYAIYGWGDNFLKSFPKACKFLRYILSQQGREDEMREGRDLPLTAPVARRLLSIFE